MNKTDTYITRLAEWAATVTLNEIPPRVIELARLQALSVLGAVHAGATSDAGAKLLESVGQSARPGRCTIIPTKWRLSPEQAIFANAALSCAHDFDDYLFMGHTGHSAVLVPLAVCQDMGLTCDQMILAQVIANEVEGRLGASALIGPLNGQMWTFIHLVGGACAAGRLMGLAPEEMANALALALAQPNMTMQVGFTRDDAKILAAATPSVQGLEAARLAAHGMKGPKEILDHSDGFYKAFSFLPLRGFLSGLGSTWVTESLALKIHPGCAYLGTAVEAVLEIMEKYREARGEALLPAEVRSIRLRTGLMTVRMEEMSAFDGGEPITPVRVNFSARLSLAVAIVAGRLGPDELTEAWLEEHRDPIRSLASRIEIVHDWDLTFDLLEAMDEALDLGALFASVSTGKLIVAMWKARGLHRVKIGELVGAVRKSRPGLAGRLWRGLVSRITGGRAKKQYTFDRVDLGRLRLPFAADAALMCSDGREYGAAKKVPAGAPGRPAEETQELVREKFRREASRNLDGQRIDQAIRMAEAMPCHIPVDAFAKLASPGA